MGNTESSIRLVESRSNSFIEAWLNSLSKRTRIAYSVTLWDFFHWLGTEDAAAVTREDVQRYLGLQKSSNLAPATINRHLAAIRAMLTEAVRHGIRSHNPAEGIKGFKAAGISKHTNAPTCEQVVELIESIGTESLIDLRDRVIIYLAAGLGMRKEEIAELTLDSMQSSHGEVVLRIVGKGSKTRSAKMPDSVLCAVRQWVVAAQLTGDAPLVQAVVNGRPTGKPMSLSTVYAAIGRRLKSAGIVGCSPHSFRAFFITEALDNGADIYKVQRAAGHSDPRTTQGYDTRRDDISDAAADYVRI